MMIAIALKAESKRKTLAFYPVLLLNIFRSGVQIHLMNTNINLKVGLCLIFMRKVLHVSHCAQDEKYSNTDLLNIVLVAFMLAANFIFINKLTSVIHA